MAARSETAAATDLPPDPPSPSVTGGGGGMAGDGATGGGKRSRRRRRRHPLVPPSPRKSATTTSSAALPPQPHVDAILKRRFTVSDTETPTADEVECDADAAIGPVATLGEEEVYVTPSTSPTTTARSSHDVAAAAGVEDVDAVVHQEETFAVVPEKAEEARVVDADPLSPGKLPPTSAASTSSYFLDGGADSASDEEEREGRDTYEANVSTLAPFRGFRAPSTSKSSTHPLTSQFFLDDGDSDTDDEATEDIADSTASKPAVDEEEEGEYRWSDSTFDVETSDALLTPYYQRYYGLDLCQDTRTNAVTVLGGSAKCKEPLLPGAPLDDESREESAEDGVPTIDVDDVRDDKDEEVIERRLRLHASYSAAESYGAMHSSTFAEDEDEDEQGRKDMSDLYTRGVDEDVFSAYRNPKYVGVDYDPIDAEMVVHGEDASSSDPPSYGSFDLNVRGLLKRSLTPNGSTRGCVSPSTMCCSPLTPRTTCSWSKTRTMTWTMSTSTTIPTTGRWKRRTLAGCPRRNLTTRTTSRTRVPQDIAARSASHATLPTTSAC